MNERAEDVLLSWKTQRSTLAEAAGPKTLGRMLTRTDRIETGAMLDSFSRPGFYIISRRPAGSDRYRNFEILSEKLPDGRIRIRLTLTRPELESLFAVLCAQTAEEALTWKNDDGGAFLRTQLKKWESLLKSSAKRLSEEEERGLFGELCLLEQAVRLYGAERAIESWTGPEDGPQDFLFPQGSVEVKTLFTRTGRISVSSLDQLDCSGPLFLCAGFIEKDPGGATLRETVDRIAALISGDANAQTGAEFLRKLDAAGYNETLGSTGSDLRWALPERRWYDAKAEGFPSLRRSQIAPGVLEARYDIALSAVEHFRTEALL